MIKVIYNTLVIVGIVLTFSLYNQNKKLKKGIIIHKNKIEELYTEVNELECDVDSLKVDTELAKYNINRNDILEAIMVVESRNNDSAYASSEDAVGCLQIRKCMVDDVNRILKRKKSTLRFTYNSRWSRDSSIQMFEIYCKHYNLTTNEEIARCWNGGPRGINNPATVGYWEKVKDKINS